MSPNSVRESIIEVGIRKVTGCFGGIECGTANAFMVEVTDRSAATLLPIIQQYVLHVLPGTTVMTDEWRSYCWIPTFGMTH